MIFIKNDKHKFYNFINEIFSKSVYDFFILKTLASQFEVKYGKFFFKHTLMLLDVFYITYFCYKNSNKSFIFMREFNTISFLINSVLLFPIRKKILINVNHNFQRACSSKLHAFIIKFLDFMGFIFFCFEDSSLCFKLKHHIIEIPFLVENNLTKNEINAKAITIGVVGSVRPEKNIEELLIKLDDIKCHFPEVVFLLGSDDSKLNHEYELKGWTVLDTKSYDNYIRAIDGSDILVFNYDANAYRYRHSGVITDAIINNKMVIVPEYPYFVKQINSPVEVGVSFSSLDVLDDAIEKAFKLANSSNRMFTHNCYCEHRSLNRIVSSLDRQLGAISEK